MAGTDPHALRKDRRMPSAPEMVPNGLDDVEVTDHTVIRWLERAHGIDFARVRHIVIAVLHPDAYDPDRPIKDAAIVRIIQNAYGLDLSPLRERIRSLASGRRIVPAHGQAYVVLEDGFVIVMAKRKERKRGPHVWFMATVLDPGMKVFRNDPTGAELLAEQNAARGTPAEEPPAAPDEPSSDRPHTPPGPSEDGSAPTDFALPPMTSALIRLLGSDRTPSGVVHAEGMEKDAGDKACAVIPERKEMHSSERRMTGPMDRILRLKERRCRI